MPRFSLFPEVLFSHSFVDQCFPQGFVADLELGGLATHVGVLPARRPRRGSRNGPGTGLC